MEALSVVKIRDVFTFNFSLTILPAFNPNVNVGVYCSQPPYEVIFCEVESLNILRAGQNVDGFLNEYQMNRIRPDFVASSTNYYNYLGQISLGQITNTRIVKFYKYRNLIIKTTTKMNDLTKNMDKKLTTIIRTKMIRYFFRPRCWLWTIRYRLTEPFFRYQSSFIFKTQ